jgi:hypothetical protein
MRSLLPPGADRDPERHEKGLQEDHRHDREAAAIHLA